MDIKLNVYMKDFKINIKFDNDQNDLQISDKNNFNFVINQRNLYFLLRDNNIKYIGKELNKDSIKNLNFDKIIMLTVSAEFNLAYLEYLFAQEAKQKYITFINIQDSIEPSIPENKKNEASEYKNKVLLILKNFGYDLFGKAIDTKTETKPSNSKTRHKWTKEISKITFFAKSEDGEGKAIWQSRDKLILLSGAKLVVNPQLNKDGSINFSAQFAQKLRLDYADKIINNHTTEDIVFQSPNQLGLFLFYGGQNTWIELKDENGKTLDELSKID